MSAQFRVHLKYQLLLVIMKLNPSFTLLFLLVSSQLFSQTHEGLIDLKGFSQLVYYSPGHEGRAKEIAACCDRANAYFQSLFFFKPTTPLFVLGPAEWSTYGTFPIYGMPHYPETGSPRLIISAEDNDFWRSFLPPLEKLPPALATKIKNAYTNKEGNLSMMAFFDLLALHELGHGFHVQAKLKMQRLWMGELFANIMLHTYIAENEPQQLLALETFPEMVVAAGSDEYQYTTLEKFEQQYDTMDPKNYGWYQCRLHVAAKNIYNAGGKDVLIKLWNALKSNSEKLTDQQLADLLKSKVHPSVAEVMLKW